MAEDNNHITVSPEFLARRRKRSIAIGLALAALIVIFYLITVVRIGVTMSPGV